MSGLAQGGPGRTPGRSHPRWWGGIFSGRFLHDLDKIITRVRQRWVQVRKKADKKVGSTFYFPKKTQTVQSRARARTHISSRMSGAARRARPVPGVGFASAARSILEASARVLTPIFTCCYSRATIEGEGERGGHDPDLKAQHFKSGPSMRWERATPLQMAGAWRPGWRWRL